MVIIDDSLHGTALLDLDIFEKLLFHLLNIVRHRDIVTRPIIWTYFGTYT